MSLGKFFHFYSRERSGAFLLLIIAGVLALFPRWYLGNVAPVKPIYLQDSIAVEQMIVALNESKAKQHYGRSFRNRIPSERDLLSWGFNAKSAYLIQKHLESGGSGDIQEISRISGIDSHEIKRLFYQSHSNSRESEAYTANHPLEINGADSVSFTLLKGIGAKTAHRILQYRTKLGGFFSTDQLLEIKYTDSIVLKGLLPVLTVNHQKIMPLDVKRLTEAELAQHPYITFKQAKYIKSYQAQHGHFNQEDLRKSPVFGPMEVARLKAYLP